VVGYELWPGFVISHIHLVWLDMGVAATDNSTAGLRIW
jgi:hypothetical protein